MSFLVQLALVILFTAKNFKTSGVKEVLDICSSLNYQDFKIIIAGEKKQITALQFQLPKYQNLADKIILLEDYKNIDELFLISDIFVLPTYREGFPTVSLEASSMRIPVLITKATGCTESIIENGTGIFINNSPDDIASKIEIYINNMELRKLHGRNGREFVCENFEEQKIWNIISEKLNY